MVLINNSLGGRTFFHRLDRDGCTMFITSADKGDIPLSGPQVTHIDIRRQVGPSKVADVKNAVLRSVLMN